MKMIWMHLGQAGCAIKAAEVCFTEVAKEFDPAGA
jgi:hypothetical protein